MDFILALFVSWGVGTGELVGVVKTMLLVRLVEESQIALIFLVAVLVAVSFWVRVVSRKFKLSPVVGYIVLGCLVRALAGRWDLEPPGTFQVLGLLAEVGIIALLYRLGLGCRLESLIAELHKASFLTFVNVVFSGVVGFVTVYYLLGFELIPSMFVAVALTATSTGVSVLAWQEANALRSKPGQLFTNMAPLDDIVAIALMVILFNLSPLLHSGAYDALMSTFLMSLLFFVIKLVFFVSCCYALSYAMEFKVIKSLRGYETTTDPMIMSASTGFVIAAFAALLGFSLALGAFFAGIVFSRDPKAGAVERAFRPLEDLFTPFFFIGIGLKIPAETLVSHLDIALVLIVCAIIGKALGTLAPALLSGLSFWSSCLLSVSMIARGEIAMVVMARGATLGTWAVPDSLYTAMVMVVLVTSLITPTALCSIMQCHPMGKK